MSFWSELKRRNVVKVGIAYAIVAWLLIQGADIIFPHLNLPSWAVTFLIVFLIIGFPLALLFAWAFEITPDGIKLTKEVPRAESITHLTGKKLNYILAALLVIAVAYIVIDKYFITPRAVETEQAPVVVKVKEAPKTIAVLPFEDLSPEKDQDYFVLGLSEEILNSLAQIPGLNVTGMTSSFTFKGSNKKTPEIANELGVENILEGSVRKAGNALRITAQLLRGADGFHLWSKTYDRELEDIFEVQEDIAMAVADELKITLGVGKSLKQLGGTDNEKAYELYLIAKGQSFTDDLNVLKHALESIDAAITLDPEFPLAWAYKSDFHSLFSIFGSPNRAASELDAAQNAAERAIELAPNLAEAYGSLGLLKVMRGDLVKAELAYQKAIELATGPLSGNKFVIAKFYLAVGLFEKANKLFREILLNDPLNKDVRSDYILCPGFLGDMQRAEEEYQRGRALSGGQWDDGDYNIALLHLVPGDFVNLDPVLTIFNYRIEAKEHIESPEEGLSELRRVYFEDDNISSSHLTAISILAAYFGDHELAMDAIEKSVSITVAGVFHIWFPVMKEVRQLPRFKKFVREVGLIDYWNKFGWPDICRQLENGDFECD